jgi:integrase/recombinase XerD
MQRSLRTYRTYHPTLDVLLRNSYSKIYVDEATREDLLKFMSDCFRLGLGSRTVYDKLVMVLQLFSETGKKEERPVGKGRLAQIRGCYPSHL